MSPNQGLEALLEGSKRNSDYQTVSKFDNLIVESSGSTRRIQRAQERRNPTSLSQKIVHRTVHDQGIQYRPDPRARARRDQGRDRRPLLPPCSSSTTAGVPPDHRLKALQPYTQPDHNRRPYAPLKARRPAQGLTCCSRTDIPLKARRPAQGLTCCSRPDILLKARLAAQGQTSCSRPDILLKAQYFT
ncbi:hypothetical protein M5K25_013899 [Dendrobium thyrsiflorum]|uniref:Uncharacterized protein n=1 Tax=Dendrobium thyrsiflorum TaxID=117978 RepID=A0ABD0V126_DENTH